MLEWLIIGGGIHGTYLSHYLTGAAGIARHRLRVIDPHPEPMACWNHHTGNTGMSFMRSTSVHHIDIDPTALRKFAKTYKAKHYAAYCPPYQRPSYQLFQKHTAEVVARYQLDRLRLQASVTGLSQKQDRWFVETTHGLLIAQNVILAIGRTALQYPTWSLPLKFGNGPIHHIFDMNFSLDDVALDQRVIVIGGGITAGQVALTLLERGQSSVTLMSRHPLQQQHFDSSPGWMGPKYLAGFRRQTVSQRRNKIQQARHRGSMSQEIFDTVQTSITDEQLDFVMSDVESATNEQSQLCLRTAQGLSVQADAVILATGFRQERPGGAWVERIIRKERLPLADCGYPIVDKSLQWGPRLYVSGALAELEVGPVAANIVGARMAATKIADSM